jgi:hypothetical protein
LAAGLDAHFLEMTLDEAGYVAQSFQIQPLTARHVCDVTVPFNPIRLIAILFKP